MKFIQGLKRLDWIIIGAVFFLTILGLAIQYSLSLNQELINFSNFYKQLVFASIGFILMLLVSFLNWIFPYYEYSLSKNKSTKTALRIFIGAIFMSIVLPALFNFFIKI